VKKVTLRLILRGKEKNKKVFKNFLKVGASFAYI